MKGRIAAGLMALMGFLVLAGCGSKNTVQGYQALLETYYGRHIDQFVSAWGLPQAQHEYSDGRKVYSFVHSSYTSAGAAPLFSFGGYFGGGRRWGGGLGFGLPVVPVVRRNYCETMITTDRQGNITDYSFRGNACRAAIEENGAPVRPAAPPDDGPAWATVCGPDAPPDCGPAYPPGWGPAHSPW